MIGVQTLGSFSILTNGKPSHGPLGALGCDFAAFLMFNSGRRYRREKLLEMFWGHLEDSKARHSMSMALWRLRAILATGSQEVAPAEIHCEAGQITFEGATSLVVDACELERCVTLILLRYEEHTDTFGLSERKALQQALKLYQGPFLEHLDAGWTIEIRDHLQSLYVRGLILLMAEYCKTDRYEDALDCARQILAVDPLRETVQRHAMRLFVLNGQRAEAIRQYWRCHQMLKEDFGVAPMPDTSELYDRIVSGEIFSTLQQERAEIHA